MKKLIFLALALFFSVTLMIGQSERDVKEMIKEKKEEIKIDKKLLKADMEELKAEKAELRQLEGEDVNYTTKEMFIEDFGNMDDVKWTSTDIFDEARFIKDGKTLTAFYDFQSNLIGTVQSITFSDLPVEGQNKISDKYKEYLVVAVMYFDNNEANNTNLVFFETPFENVDNYFVELMDGSKKIVLMVDDDGDVSFFKHLK